MKTAKSTKVDDRMRRFCVLYLKTGNGAQSYREAYDAKGTDKTCAERASRLLSEYKVSAMVERIRQRAIEASGVTLSNHLQRLDRAYWCALRKGQVSAAVSAEKARGEVAGLYTSDGRLGRNAAEVPAEPVADAPSVEEAARSLLILMQHEAKAKRGQKEARKEILS